MDLDDGQWWVLREGSMLGPYGLGELRQYAMRGNLLSEDLVSAAGESEWSPAGQSPALRELFPADGSEDATVALKPSLLAMSAPPVPARRPSSESLLQASPLPPHPSTRPPAAEPEVPLKPAAPAKEPIVKEPAARPPPAPTAGGPRLGLGTGLAIGLASALGTLALQRMSGPAPGSRPATPAAVVAVVVDAGAATGTTRPAVDVAVARAAADGGAAPTTPAGRTQAMLRSLEGVMEGASPPADPFDYATVPGACMTSVARSNDRAMAALDGARAAEALRVRRGAEARQAARAQQWQAMAWTWDLDWRTRSVNRSASYGCYEDGWTSDPLETCPGEWRQRSTALSGPVYVIDGQPAEPELARRASAAGLHPEAEQACEVRDAVAAEQRLTVTCEAGGGALFELRLPRELAAPGSGALAGLRVGDVLRVTGHRVLRREPGAAGAPGRWVFDEVPATGVALAAPARRCAG